MPDFPAAVNFAWEADRFDLYPVAILDRTVQNVRPAALASLSGRRIRAFPHADSDGVSAGAMDRWAWPCRGAEVDAFDLTGLRRSDGKTAKDLNDCAVIHTDDFRFLGELLPDSPDFISEGTGPAENGKCDPVGRAIPVIDPDP